MNKRMKLSDLQKLTKKANSRIRSARKFFGDAGHSSLSFAQHSIQMAGGKKYFPAPSEKMTVAQLRRIEAGVKKVMDSPFFTARGRANYRRETIDRLSEQFEVTHNEAMSLLDILESDLWDEVREIEGRGGYSTLAVIQMTDVVRENRDRAREEIISNMKSYLKVKDKIPNYATFLQRSRKIANSDKEIDMAKAGEKLVDILINKGT